MLIYPSMGTRWMGQHANHLKLTG
ncbi:hypothetical protein BCEP4_1530017 [Burkholderia cepacia]|nr:hypothetical protein BCEP4_1530017 [Burkholderia cepacia]